jgi:hypothetical protein
MYEVRGIIKVIVRVIYMYLHWSKQDISERHKVMCLSEWLHNFRWC